MDLREGHAVLGEDEGGEADGLYFDVGVLAEEGDGEHHDEGALGGSLPDPA
jgi:hypothetical protein